MECYTNSSSFGEREHCEAINLVLLNTTWYIRDKDYQMYKEVLPKIIQWIKDNYDNIPYLDSSNEYYRIAITPTNAFELSIWATPLISDRKYSYKKRIVLSSDGD